MAIETASPSTLAPITHPNQILAPVYLRGNFLSDDTDNHDFIVNARGKYHLSMLVSTTGTSTYTTTLYGSHSSGAAVGDAGVVSLINSTTLVDGGVFNNSSGVFPFYITRLQKGDTGEDGSALTVNVYINLVN